VQQLKTNAAQLAWPFDTPEALDDLKAFNAAISPNQRVTDAGQPAVNPNANTNPNVNPNQTNPNTTAAKNQTAPPNTAPSSAFDLSKLFAPLASTITGVVSSLFQLDAAKQQIAAQQAAARGQTAAAKNAAGAQTQTQGGTTNWGELLLVGGGIFAVVMVIAVMSGKNKKTAVPATGKSRKGA